MGRGPLIGITTSFERGLDVPLLPGRRLLFLTTEYVDALEQTGASLVILPLCRSGQVPPVMEHLSGLVVTGNERPVPRRVRGHLGRLSLHDLNPERYDSDAGWIRLALERGMPVLAVCRGMQTLNEVLGGNTVRLPKLPDGRSHAQSLSHDQTWHQVEVEPTSLLGQALGLREVPVNSFHLQGVGECGPGVLVSARAPDGSVEAIEYPPHPFCLGLQFHPEKLLGRHPAMARIYAAFAAAAMLYQARQVELERAGSAR